MRFKEILSEEQLDEIRMSPSTLRKWAQSEEAEGIQAGFEAEMIFRDTQRDGDEDEMEPDYDMDRRPDGIDDVIDFFSDDEYGYGMSSRSASRVRDGLWEEFIEWREEAIADEWSNVAEDQVRDYMESNVWGDDSERESRIRDVLNDLDVDDVDGVMAAGEAAPRFTKSSDQKEYAEKNPLYKTYLDASDAAYRDFEEEIETEISTEGNYYDEARDYYRDMMADSDEFTEEDFLAEKYGTMSDIADSWSLDWPYWLGGNRGGGGRSIDDIASELARELGVEVRAGSGYHSVSRKPGRWIVEPDGSLEPDDYEDAGLEIVSPPMPLPEALERLEEVIEWGNRDGNAYTNDSTGLHMGVSIPFVGGDVDYVKLILFMGDQYVLEKFGRAGNTYCRSAMAKIKDRVTRARERGELSEAAESKMGDALELIKKNLIELAHRYVQGGVGQDKYTSAHIKPGYIEFRSPGGDYLAMADRNEMSDIKNTMLRFARAMYIAGHAAVERKEYAKKLTKLLTQDGGDDALKLFSEYAAGTLSPEELKKQWARAVLQKEQPTEKYEFEVLDDTGMKDDSGNTIYKTLGTVRARDREEALELTKEKYDDWYRKEVRLKQNKFDIYDADTGETLETIEAGNLQDAQDLAMNKWAGKGKEFAVKPHDEPAPKKPSRRAELAKKLTEKPIWWRVDFGDKNILVRARNEEDAKSRAETQDTYFGRNRSYVKARAATRDEIEQWQQQASDNQQDSDNIQRTVAGDTGETGYYRVSWTETRDGREIHDSINIDADSAEAAVYNITRTLNATSRAVRPGSVQATPIDPPAWRQRQRSTSEPIPGSTLDLQRQRAQQASNVPAGIAGVVWEIRDANGRLLTSVRGIGSQRETAERYARNWLDDNNYPADTQITVTPLVPQSSSTDDPAQRQAQQAEPQRQSIYTGQWTGRWQVKNANTGEVVYTFTGAGNNQGDANRIAQLWVQQTRFDDPVEVVPEMA